MSRLSDAHAAIGHIDWCCTIPHDIDRLIGHAVESAQRVAEERPLPAPAGGYRDPTASGATALAPEPESVRTMRSAAALCIDLVGRVDVLARRHNPAAPVMQTSTSLSQALRHATIPLHAHAHVLELVGAHGDEDIDWLLRELVDTAHWLHDKCECVWDEHKRRPVAEQRAMRWCRSCERADHHVPIDVDRYADYCRSCGEYRRATGDLPPVAWCEHVWARGRRPSPAVTARMVADERRRGRRRRTA